MTRWTLVPFTDVIASKGSGSASLPAREWREEGLYPIIGQGADFIEGWTDRNDLVVRPNAPLVLYGGHTRRSKFVAQPFVPGPNVKILRPVSRLDAAFLNYFLTYLPVESKGYADHFPVVRKALIPLPPLEEQRRIVAVLDEVSAAIAIATANAEKNLAYARELSAMFPVSSSANNTRIAIGELLERGWLKDHMDGNHGGDYPRKDEFVGEGVTYLSANCIRDGLVDLNRAKFLTRERAGKLRKGFAKSRDVLFAHNATVGPVALLQTEEDFVVLGTSLTYYRCDEDAILPEYLASYLRSPGFVKQYTAVMRQSTRNQVPITKQRELYVDLPPIAEQRRLMASLTSFQEDGRALAALYRAKLDAIDVLKQSLLHRAFTGELTAAMPKTIAA